MTAAVSARIARVLLLLLMIALTTTAASAQTAYVTSPASSSVYCNWYQSPNLELLCYDLAVKDSSGTVIGYAQFMFIVEPSGTAVTGTITVQNTSFATLFTGPITGTTTATVHRSSLYMAGTFNGTYTGSFNFQFGGQTYAGSFSQDVQEFISYTGGGRVGVRQVTKYQSVDGALSY